MINFRSQPTKHDDKLPIEYPLQEALNIYSKRLKTFFVIAIINILVFLFFIAIQRLPFQFINLLSINMAAVTFCLVVIFLTLILSFAYLRKNPVTGELIFSHNEVKILSVSLYSGWNTTKKRFHLPERHWGKNLFLVARKVKQRDYPYIDEPSRQIYIKIQDKSRKIIYEGMIFEGDIMSFYYDEISVSYHS